MQAPTLAIIVIGALTAASAHPALPRPSAESSAHECTASDRMPLLGCIEGEAARLRAERKWCIDPGMVLWADASTLQGAAECQHP